MKKLTQQEIENELIALTIKLLSESGEPFKRDIKIDSSLQHQVGIDSITRAELLSRVERSFDVTLPDKLLSEAETLGDISVFLQSASTRIKEPTKAQQVVFHHERSNVDPHQANTLIETLILYATHSPDKPHVYFQHDNGSEEIITYAKLLHCALCIAQSFRERGLREGETVAIMLPTHPGFLYTFFGVLLAGGIPVPIYPPFRMHMLESYAKTEAKILRNAEVRFLVTFAEAATLSKLLQAFVPSLKEVTNVDALLNQTPLTSFYSAKATSPAFIQYTSGSTNDPKGVLISHDNAISNIRCYGEAAGVQPDDVAVSWLPLYHDMGLIGAWLGSFYHGVPLVLMTPFSFLSHPAKWLWAMHYHRGTMTGGPNFAYELCINKVDHVMLEGLDLSAWRFSANGAEKVYPRTLETFNKKFAPYGLKPTVLKPLYGLAESTVCVTMPPVDRAFRIDQVDRKKFEEERIAEPAIGKNFLEFVGAGTPIIHHEVRIVGDENQVLPERHVGSLHFRGPSNMQGYYNNPAATMAVFREGGWIDSGDLAYLADGEVFITGRRKDLIIKAGRNLYPVEIEELVGNIPGIRQGCVAAFGVTDADRGTEQLVVVAETREKNKAKREQLQLAIHTAISTTLDISVDHIELVAPRMVPKTSSGKLQRAACKQMYLDGRHNHFQLPPWAQIIKLSALWVARKCTRAFTLTFKALYTFYLTSMLFLSFLIAYPFIKYGSASLAMNASRLWSKFLVLATLCPHRIKNKKYLYQAKPMVFVANHASYTDAILAISFLPKGTRIVGKKELLTTPIIGTIMQKLNYLFVDRADSTKGAEDTQRFIDVLRSGNSLFIFPEGTFGYAAGLRPFRLGAFKVAAEAGVPICPIALSGTRKILREESKLLSPARLEVTVCKPMHVAGTDWEDVTRLRAEARSEIAKYCGEPSLDLIAAQTVAVKIPVSQ